MAISYPLTMPAYPAPASVRITANNAVAISESPYTGTQQVQEWPNEAWAAEWSLPSLLDEQAGQWRGFLSALRGMSGTFLMGPAGFVAPHGTQGDIYNLLNCSEQLTVTPYWIGIATGVSGPVATDNAVLNPFGGNSGSAIAFPSTLGGGQVSEIAQSCPPLTIAGQVFTASVWLRVNSPITVTLAIADINQTASIAQSVNVGTTWQRFSVSVQFPITSTRSAVQFILQQYGQIAVTIYAYGAQLERGVSDPSDYQMTGVQPGVNTTTYGPGSKLVQLSWPAAGKSLLAGDWLQIGQHLYLATQDSVHSGNDMIVDIYPRLRLDATNGTPAYFVDPVGLWRLSENPRGWGIQPGAIHDFNGIKCREVL